MCVCVCVCVCVCTWKYKCDMTLNKEVRKMMKDIKWQTCKSVSLSFSYGQQ